jgi:hypothetical protein
MRTETRSDLETRNESSWYIVKLNVNTKAIPLTGRREPCGCEMSKLPHFLDNRLTDGGEVVSLMLRPNFTPRKIFWYSFVLEIEATSWPQ